jgi:hypothetical protein
MGRVPARLLRREVRRRAEDRPGARQRSALVGRVGGGRGDRSIERHRLREPEVREQDSTALVDEDVRRLHVAMHETRVAARGERRSDRVGHVERSSLVERADAREHVRQRLAFDDVHHEERHVALLPDEVNRHHARMFQLGLDARLAKKTLTRRVRRREEHLQRDLALEARVPRAIHGAHPAAPQTRVDAKVPERLPDQLVAFFLPLVRLIIRRQRVRVRVGFHFTILSSTGATPIFSIPSCFAAPLDRSMTKRCDIGPRSFTFT